MKIEVRDPRTEWLGEIRPGTDDETIVREVYTEDVYRLNQGLLREGDVVIDIGAHVGTFSIRAAAYGATVVAVEPNQENAMQLLANAVAAGQVKRITLMLAGVSSDGGSLTTHSADGSAYTEEGVWGSPAGVLSLTLNSLIAGTEIRLLKVDCEGAEYAMLAAPDLALSTVANIAMEWHAAPMLNGRDPGGTVGSLVEALLPTHHVEVFGKPDVGGFVWATLYGLEPRLELPVT